MSHKNENEIETDPKISYIITNLKNRIDHLGITFNTIKEDILQLAIHLDEDKKCERHEICALIKKLLSDKVKEGKVSARWIEDCLPNEYKRTYSKSELTSHSDNRRAKPLSIGQYAVQEFEENESIGDLHNDVLDKKYESTHIDDENDILKENAELKEEPLKQTFENTLDQEHKFEVYKEKLVEIIDWLKNCEERCFLIFNHGILIRIESDMVTS